METVWELEGLVNRDGPSWLCGLIKDTNFGVGCLVEDSALDLHQAEQTRCQIVLEW